MSAPREDSVLTSIQEIQRLEQERLRDIARRAAEEERARTARLEEARLEAERQVEARRAALEAERAEEQRRRDESERKEREAREARELALRSRAEAEREARAREQAEAHARAMAEIEARSHRGAGGVVVTAMVLGAVMLTGALGYFGLYEPTMRRHAAQVQSLEARERIARGNRDEAERQAVRLAERIHAVSTATPTPVVAPAVRAPVVQHVPQAHGAHPQAPRTRTPELNLDLDGNDPFALDDGAQRRSR